MGRREIRLFLKRPAALLVAAGMAPLAAGCAYFSRPEREFVSQADVLQAVAKTSGYTPSESAYRLRQAEVSSDMVTFYYQGASRPGDRAWVIRFSTKNTEQEPEDLVKIGKLIQAIRAGKDGFQEGAFGRREVGDLIVEFMSYRFRSASRDDRGAPVTAAGIAAVTRVHANPAPVVYHLNVVNMEGDEIPGWKEIEPLVEAIRQD